MSVQTTPAFGSGRALGPIHVEHSRATDFGEHATVSHTEHVISYVVAGSLQVEHGAQLRLMPGTVSLIPAGVPHRFVGGRDVELWGAAFCAGCLSLDEEHPLMLPFKQARLGVLPIVHIPRRRRARVARLFREMAEEHNLQDATSAELARCLLLVLLGEVRRSMSDTMVEGSGEATMVGDALGFIQRHCLDAISLKDVANFVGRSAGHLATTVKDATGYTVGEWISSVRVSEAAMRLAHTDDSLEDIAQQVGWADRTHFTRQFKKNYGVTPAAWRRQHRARHSLGT